MYSLDGKKPKELDLKPSQTEIDIDPSSEFDKALVDEEWNKASLYGKIEISEETIEDVFPAEERESPPAKLYVAVQCHETIYRDRVDASEAPTDHGTYDITIPLERDEVRGKVEFRPFLIRAESGIGEEGYASERNVRVAGGDSYTIIVDRSEDEEPPSIDGEEASFSRRDHLPDGERLYYLDFRNESRPKLWINADNPRITDVLQSKGSVGAEPRMRDVVLDQISYGVWTQLILRTAEAIDEQGDVEYEWQETVISTFARELYDVDDATESAHLLRDEVLETEGLSYLMQRIDGELQEYIEPRTQLINLMEEGLQI
jgi:hypothetical protein